MEKGEKNINGYYEEYFKTHKQVRVTFTNVEHGILEEVATKQGLTVAQFIRVATNEQARNLYLFPREIEEKLLKVVMNFKAIGNNINQIAKYTNEQRFSSPDTIQVLLNHLLNLENEVKATKLVIDDAKTTTLTQIEKKLKKIEEEINKNENDEIKKVLEELFSLIKYKK